LNTPSSGKENRYGEGSEEATGESAIHQSARNKDGCNEDGG
jgi:hypothetical protein